MPSCRLILLGLTLGVALAGSAFAQSEPDAGSDTASTAVAARQAPDPQRQAHRLARRLQLNPQQAAAIEPILQSRAQQMDQLRADSSLSSRERHMRLRAMNQDTDSRLQAVLTDSQRQQYRQMMQQAKLKRQNRKDNAANPPPAPDGGE
jgi:protein CpxP